MKISISRAAMRYSERDLNLTHRGFSGEEWTNGTAKQFFRDDYRRALLERDPSLDLLDDELELDFG